MRSTVAVALAGLVIASLPVPAAGAQTDRRTRQWDFSLASGVGVREVDSAGYGVPYLGFWAAREKSDSLEVVYEGFVLMPTTKGRGPSPIGFAPGIDMEGTSTYRVHDIELGGFVRINHYFRDGRVRPYVTIGGGLVFYRRVREWTRVTRELPDGAAQTTFRRDPEPRIGLNSVVGVGVRFRLAEGWHLRPEARIPFPYLPWGLGHPATSVALVMGITYSPF